VTSEDISVILFRYDIVKLASMGCPTDEYDAEARMIAEGMDECESEIELTKLIASIFTRMFCYATNPKTGVTRKTDLDYKPEGKIAKVASEIWTDKRSVSSKGREL